MEGKDGELFVSMPSYKTNRKDKEGKDIYNSICNPITADFRSKLNDAILKSFNEGEPVSFDDGEKIKMAAMAIAYDNPKGGSLGNAKIYINDSFVISGIGIRENADGKRYLTMPSFKSTRVDESGKAIYQEFVYPANDTIKKDMTNAVNEKFEESLQIKLEAPEIENPFLQKEDEKKDLESLKDKKETKKSISSNMKEKKEQVEKQPLAEATKDKGKEK